VKTTSGVAREGGMKKQQTILLGVFVVLLALFGLQRWQRGKIVVSEPAETVQIDPAQVTRVAIQRPDGEVELVRDGSGWKMTKPNQYAASRDLVDQMLKSVEELKLEDIISSNPAKRATYQVDSTGTAVDLYIGDKPALSIVVGKSSADWTHTFVRRKDGDSVYRAEGVLAYNFNRRPEDWRDKSILDLDADAVQRITMDQPKEKLQVQLVRADSLWNVVAPGAGPEPADSLQAASVVRSAAKLASTSFATPEEAAGKDFTAPDFRLVVEAGGMTYSVDFVTLDESRMLARRSGTETIFSLYKINLANLMKKAEDLRRKKV
jgi:hypothetical protein